MDRFLILKIVIPPFFLFLGSLIIGILWLSNNHAQGTSRLRKADDPKQDFRVTGGLILGGMLLLSCMALYMVTQLEKNVRKEQAELVNPAPAHN